jgi:hypothetical protein
MGRQFRHDKLVRLGLLLAAAYAILLLATLTSTWVSETSAPAPAPAALPPHPISEPPPAGPPPAERPPAEPPPAEPPPAEPPPAESGPTGLDPAEPRPAEPQPAEPQPAEPQPAEPQPAEPQPAELGHPAEPPRVGPPRVVPPPVVQPPVVQPPVEPPPVEPPQADSASPGIASPATERQEFLDRQLSFLRAGHLVYRPPSPMRLNDWRRVVVRVSGPLVPPDFEKDLPGSGAVRNRNVRVGSDLIADLTGTDFNIVRVGSDDGRRTLATGTFTEWQWDVQPLRSGPRSLSLTLHVRLQDGGPPVDVRTYVETIDVQVVSRR